jgi:hypothetical protein
MPPDMSRKLRYLIFGVGGLAVGIAFSMLSRAIGAT